MSLPPTIRPITWILLSVLLLTMLSGCVTTPPPGPLGPDPAPNVQPSACEDARYKALLQTSFEIMGDSEYDYFLQMDKQCRQHQRVHSGDAFKVCEHARYVELLNAKSLKDMTAREYMYFIEVDRECAVWKKTAVAPQPQPQSQPEKKTSFAIGIFTGLAVLGVTLANLVGSLR